MTVSFALSKIDDAPPLAYTSLIAEISEGKATTTSGLIERDDRGRIVCSSSTSTMPIGIWTDVSLEVYDPSRVQAIAKEPIACLLASHPGFPIDQIIVLLFHRDPINPRIVRHSFFSSQAFATSPRRLAQKRSEIVHYPSETLNPLSDRVLNLLEKQQEEISRLTSQMQKIIDHLIRQREHEMGLDEKGSRARLKESRNFKDNTRVSRRRNSSASSSSSSAWSSEASEGPSRRQILSAVVTDDEVDAGRGRQTRDQPDTVKKMNRTTPVQSNSASVSQSCHLPSLYASDVRKRLQDSIQVPSLPRHSSGGRQSLNSFRFSMEKPFFSASPQVKGSTGSAPPSAEPTAVRPSVASSLFRSSTTSSMFTFSSICKRNRPSSPRPIRSFNHGFSSDSDDGFSDNDEDDEATRRILAKYAKLALTRN